MYVVLEKHIVHYESSDVKYVYGPFPLKQDALTHAKGMENDLPKKDSAEWLLRTGEDSGPSWYDDIDFEVLPLLDSSV